MRDILQAEIDDIRHDCLLRIERLRQRLDYLDHRVREKDILNDLGELQTDSTMLECRIASLAVLQRLQRLAGREDNPHRRHAELADKKT